MSGRAGRLWLSLLSAFCLWPIHCTVLAQDGVSGEPEKEQPEPTERVFRYVDDAVFLFPGRGLGRVTLGTPLSTVVQILGAPRQSDRSGFFNPQTTLLYDAGVNAWLVVRGDKVVEEVGVEGRTGITTPEGIGFGMPGHQVKLIYGEPVVTKDGKYRYPERGVSFALRSGTVFQVEAFAPEPRGD